MDALSSVLSLLKPASYMFRAIDGAGDWAIRFPAHAGIMCCAALSGQVWLTVEGGGDGGNEGSIEVLLQTGDCVLLPKALAVRLGSAIDASALDVCDVMPRFPEGGVVTLNGGGEAFGLGGYFSFDGRHAELLLDALPPIVHIRQEADRVALRLAIERIMQELREPQPGGYLAAQHLAHLVLLQALRAFLAEQGAAGQRGVGWLHALGDRQIGLALNAMHADVARKWTLQSLAQSAHMSRSSFALRFKERVGEAPIDYLTRWRMLLAAERLAHTREPVSLIAPSLGYQSESAFSTAFRRIIGCSPRDYGRAARAGQPTPTDDHRHA